MAISRIEFNFLLEAYRQNIFTAGKNILEFGESESLVNLSEAIKLLIPEGGELDRFLAEATSLEDTSSYRYDSARLIYRAMFKPASYASIDLCPAHGHQIQQDLNKPFDLGKRYDICINNGTTEHIFNQANCYKAIHDHTIAGGLMIHWTPCLGWINHGLFNVQPGFFHDLALANDYEILLASLCSSVKMYTLPPSVIDEAILAANPDLRNSLACVILRKKSDADFKFPLQGTFSHLSAQLT